MSLLRANLTTSGTPLVKNRAAFQRKFTRMMHGLVEGARVHIQQPVLQELQALPGPVSRPISWVSDRQRIFVILKLKRENNYPYNRTGGTARKWRVVAMFTPNGGGISIYNNAPSARFIYGSLTRGNSFQQSYHRRTGWITALPRVDYYLREASAFIDEGFDQALERYAVLEQRVGI